MKVSSTTVIAVLAVAQYAFAAPGAAALERRLSKSGVAFRGESKTNSAMGEQCTVDNPEGWIPGTTCDNNDQCASCSCIYGDTPIGQDWICA